MQPLNHCSTRHDQSRPVRPCQRDRLLTLLKSRAPDYVSVGEIIVVAGAQYSARIYELRRLGHRIESKQGGGWFRLVTRPVSNPATAPSSTSVNSTPVADQRLFPDDAPLRHLDLG
jgi:hypothetical protein